MEFWISGAFTITNGLNDYDISAIAPFVCHDSTCGGCLAPTIVQGFQASDVSCSQVSMT
ncbi:MAG: hypothetical protein IPP40_13970 [bacterium]|nr:hypothetical protein [bacterium]